MNGPMSFGPSDYDLDPPEAKSSKDVPGEMREHFGPFIDRASLDPCHYEGCWKDHFICAIARLLDTCDRLQSARETGDECPTCHGSGSQDRPYQLGCGHPGPFRDEQGYYEKRRLPEASSDPERVVIARCRCGGFPRPTLMGRTVCALCGEDVPQPSPVKAPARRCLAMTDEFATQVCSLPESHGGPHIWVTPADEAEVLRHALKLIADGVYTEKGAQDWAAHVLAGLPRSAQKTPTEVPL